MLRLMSFQIYKSFDKKKPGPMATGKNPRRRRFYFFIPGKAVVQDNTKLQR